MSEAPHPNQIDKLQSAWASFRAWVNTTIPNLRAGIRHNRDRL